MGRVQIVVVACILAVLPMIGTAPAALPKPDVTAPPVTVLIAGAPSEVMWRRERLDDEAETRCILFFVSASPAPLSLTLTTIGLGRGRLAKASARGCPPADAAAWAEQLTLAVAADNRRYPVALRLDPHSAPPDGGQLEGRIVAIAGGSEAGSATLKVRPKPDPAWFQSFQWFVGFAVPALFAFMVTRGGNWLAARDDFLAYRVLEADQIGKVVEAIQTALDDPKIELPGRIVYEEIRKGGVLEKLALRKKRRIVDFCYKNDMAGLVVMMKKLFPRQTEGLHFVPAAAQP
jgi:hypothetical protein